MSSLFLTGVEEKYPKKLLEGRLTTEGNVIGVIYNDPATLDEMKLTGKDFISKDGHFYFCLASALRKKGYTVFDEVTIMSSCSSEILDKFEDRGGYESIKNLCDIIDMRNADIYVDNLFRENILLKLHKDGFNVLSKIELKDKEVAAIDHFRKMGSQDVIDWYESKLSGMDTARSSAILEEEMVDYTDEFLEQCSKGDADGVPFESVGEDINGDTVNCYKFLSKQISGLRRKTLSMIGGFSSAGKSTWMIAIILSMISAGEKVILVSNEEEIKKYKIKLMVWLLNKHFKYYNLTKKKISAGEITDEDRIYLAKFQELWKKRYKDSLYLVAINDSDINTTKKKIRKLALDRGFTMFILDTFKMEQSDMSNARSDLALVRDSRELAKLANKYNMIGLCSIQLAEGSKGGLFLDASVLSNSKQVKEVCENLFLMRTVYPEELDKKNKIYCSPFRIVKKENKWIEEPFEADPKDVWRMLFVEKNRNGANSSDTGEAYLLKFNGDYALFIEKAKCRPKHGRIQ